MSGGWRLLMQKPTVHLVDYDPSWPAQFEEDKERILSAAKDNILGIEHIGSTSIQGLSAKPIIDIVVGIRDLNAVESLIEPLEQAGYEYVHKPELVNRRFFRKGPWGKGTTHVHVCEFKGEQWKEKLAFRDYLRANPDVRKEYEALKRELASRYEDDRPTYTSEKEPFIRKVIAKAGVK